MTHPSRYQMKVGPSSVTGGRGRVGSRGPCARRVPASNLLVPTRAPILQARLEQQNPLGPARRMEGLNAYDGDSADNCRSFLAGYLLHGPGTPNGCEAARCARAPPLSGTCPKNRRAVADPVRGVEHDPYG